MKKWLVGGVTVALALSLAACSQQTAATSHSDSTDKQSEKISQLKAKNASLKRARLKAESKQKRASSVSSTSVASQASTQTSSAVSSSESITAAEHSNFAYLRTRMIKDGFDATTVNNISDYTMKMVADEMPNDESLDLFEQRISELFPDAKPTETTGDGMLSEDEVPWGEGAQATFDSGFQTYIDQGEKITGFKKTNDQLYGVYVEGRESPYVYVKVATGDFHG